MVMETPYHSWNTSWTLPEKIKYLTQAIPIWDFQSLTFKLINTNRGESFHFMKLLI